MKRCERTAQLTAYLTGDLPEAAREAMRVHLEACAECREQVDEIRGTLSRLQAFFDGAAGDEAGARLDPARRAALLAVRPARPGLAGLSWWTHHHTLLRAAAAVAVIGLGLYGLLTAQFVGRDAGALRRVLGDDWAETAALDADTPAGDAGSAQAGDRFGLETPAAAPEAVDARRKDAKPLTDTLSLDLSGKNEPAANGREWFFRTLSAEPATPGTADRVAAREKKQALAETKKWDTDGDGYAAHSYKPDLPSSKREVRFAEETAAPEGRVGLKIAVPKPQFTGTPKDLRSPNLEGRGLRTSGPYHYDGTVRQGPQSGSGLGEAQPAPAAVLADQAPAPPAPAEPAAEAAGVPALGDLPVLGKLFKQDERGRAAGPSAADKEKRVSTQAAQAERLRKTADLLVTAAGSRVDSGGEEASKARETRARAESAPAAASFNPFVAADAQPFSTFAIDVDTASYTLARQALRGGALPEPERVRIEEIVNAFDYGDRAPERTVFRVYADGAQAPFGAGLHLLRIGVKGRRLGREEQRPAMLTFVIDVSGSMSQPDRIGLARTALRLLLENLSAADRIQLIAYSDRAQLVLEPVAASEGARVMAAFDRLQCNGSTNLEAGLREAYAQAARAFAPGAENRVILISDGVANLGADSAREIVSQVEAYRKQGITCSVFGVGAGTYNDRMLEELANTGDGVYRFLDAEAAVREAFVDDLAATLNTIAKDAKIQVEWDPAVVRRYRQLGYENRALTREQFRDDAVDAGEVGSGQSASALYELELAPDAAVADRLGCVRIRYRRADTGAVEEIEAALSAETVLRPARAASARFRVAACAAEFAELLRGSPYAAGGSFGAVADYLRPAALELPLDTRVSELLELVEAAAAITR